LAGIVVIYSIYALLYEVAFWYVYGKQRQQSLYIGLRDFNTVPLFIGGWILSWSGLQVRPSSLPVPTFRAPTSMAQSVPPSAALRRLTPFFLHRLSSSPSNRSASSCRHGRPTSPSSRAARFSS